MRVWPYILLVAFIATAAHAQAINPPGSIDLTVKLHDDRGKPIKDETERAQGLIVLASFTDDDGRVYKKGATITNAQEMREVGAILEARKTKFMVGILDPDCAECRDLDFGWAISQALTARLCPAQASQPKPAECTAEEEKIENDTVRMQSRLAKAREIRDGQIKSLVLGPRATVELQNLIIGRFKVAPEVIAQLMPAIAPAASIPEFGKD